MASKIKVNAIETSSGSEIKVGSGVTVTSAGALTASSFVGDGSQLTNIPSGAIVGAVAQADVDKINANIAVLGFKVAVNGSLAKYNLVDQVIDEFTDATGVDASASTNEFLEGGFYVGVTAGANYPTGGTVTTHGSYRVHSFTNTGNTNFVVNTAGTVDMLIVAGGGGGGCGINGAGGGAGGMLQLASQSVTDQTYTVTVGAGGAGGPANSSNTTFAANGGNSSVSGGFTVAVGGGGGANNARSNSQVSSAGGSAGGFGIGGSSGSATAGQGNAGGGLGGTNGVAGGGGAGEAGGTDGIRSGGDGLENNWRTGSNVFYAGGGSGAEDSNRATVDGGQGGGGHGIATNSDGDNGDANTGGGGGGAGENAARTGGNGGSGIVVIRYATSEFQNLPGNQLTLQSNASTASSAPTKGDLIVLIENKEGTATLNTDIKGYVSRDNGSNWTQGTFVDEGSWGSNRKIISFHNLDISGQPSGTSVKYKITTHNQSGSGTKKIPRIHATSLGWK